MERLACSKLLQTRCTVEQFIILMIGSFSTVAYINMMFQQPAWPQVLCPDTYYSSLGSLSPVLSAGGGATTQPINCSALFRADTTQLRHASQLKQCKQINTQSNEDFIEATEKCEDFVHKQGYMTKSSSDEEVAFPIAFSILTYENLAQTERLLHAVYQPQNIICIHPDRNSDRKFRDALQAITGCLPDNVFVIEDPVRMRWAEFPILEAELLCMSELLRRNIKWKYFINLTGREFPLRTNKELVQILRAYDGANDIDGSAHSRPLIWTKYSWRSESWMSSVEKSPPPEDFVIHKGSAHIAASRAFVEYAVYNESAQALLQWMKDIRAPDEHYFQTLNHNPQKNIPGAFMGDPGLKVFQTRYKVWQSAGETCSGKWQRFICNLGSGDLYRLQHAKQLFVNKFRSEDDPIAFECMQHWYNQRNNEQSSQINIDFYKQLPWVNKHTHNTHSKLVGGRL